MKTLNANERFELVADLFYAETGYLRPGKSVPYTLASDDYEDQRHKAWFAWIGNDRLVESALIALADARKRIEELTKEGETWTTWYSILIGVSCSVGCSVSFLTQGT